jgi:hypothetical protein
MIKLFLFLVLAFPLASESALLKGTVLEKGVRLPVGEASVILLPEKIRTTTNSKGEFELDSELSVNSKIIVQKTGYDKFELEAAGESPSLNIYLSKISGLEYETTIVSQEKKDPSLRKIKAREAVQLPGSASDAIKAIQNLPGVNRTPGFSSQIVVQGSAPEDTRYSIDGHEVPLMFHFGGISSVLMPELLSDIDFYTAGYQAPFGRALGGIVNANTLNETPLTDTTRVSKGMAYFDLFNMGGAFSAPVGNESHIALGARASYVGEVLKQAAKSSDKFNLTVAPAFQDLAGVYESPINDHLKFKLSAIYSKDTAEFLLKEPIGEDPALRGAFSNSVQFFRFIPQFEWTHSSRSKTKLSLGIGQDKIENVVGNIYFNLSSLAMTARGENETQETATWAQTFGFDHRYSWSDVSFSLPQIFSSGGVLNPISTGDTRTAALKGVKSHQLGLYWTHRWKPALDSLWTFYPGVRLDYFSIVTDLQLSPRFSVRYQYRPDLSFTLASGRVTQAPAEQFVSKNYGNPNIKSTHAYHLSLKGEKDLSEEWSKGSSFTSGVFGKLMDNLILPDSKMIYANKGFGSAIGWENSVNYKFYPFTIYGAYTLSRSARWDPENTVYLSRYDQTHYLTMIGAVDLPKNWRISARFRYVTGPLTTPIASGVYDSDNDVFIPIRGSSYSQRLDSFSSLDIRFDKRWIYERWVLSLYIDIQNALNRSNTESVQYSYDFASKVNIAGLPILPTIGLKGEF